MEVRFPYFLLLVLLIGACSKDTRPQLSDLRIAYNVYYDTATRNYEIFTMNTDGTDQKNITNSEGMDWVYYAFQDKLYFISDRDTSRGYYFLYEMDAEGNGVRKVSDLRLEDSFLSARRNGAELVVAGRLGKDLRNQLYLLNTQDGSYKAITASPESYFNSPYFSPDGEEIAAMYLPKRADFRTEKTEIWIMKADGTGLRKLTDYPADDTTATWQDYYAGPPVWEPVSNVISFMSKRKGNYSIFTIHPDGTGLSQVTDDKMSEGWHTWSPDGQWITYDGSDIEANSFDIYLIRADGSGVRQLTTDWRFEQAPVFVQKSAP